MKSKIIKTTSLTHFVPGNQENFILFGLLLLLTAASPFAQQPVFVSGSTGADGAFNPAASQEIQLPESGVFNYTTVTIPTGVVITYKRNSKNTPVTILASGNVNITGKISIIGKAGSASRTVGGGAFVGVGGPGGFDGGRGGSGFEGFLGGTAGQGPGGGSGGVGGNNNVTGGGGGFSVAGDDAATTQSIKQSGTGGARYGTPTLLPLIGGSGGGGGGSKIGETGGAGGGGGGAILIASSGNIIFQAGADISATGADGSCAPAFGNGHGAGGAGGAVRLIANTISGNPFINVDGGGLGCNPRIYGASGYIRIEAYTYNNLNLGGSLNSTSFGLPNSATLPNSPQLKIKTIAGQTTPVMPTGSYYTPDLVVPNSQSGPVTVALEAANMPLDTIIRVTLTPDTGPITIVSSTPLAGTTAASTATASVTLPVGVSLIHATATINFTNGIASLAPIYIEGERVKQMEIATAYGGGSEVIYITESGKRIKPKS